MLLRPGTVSCSLIDSFRLRAKGAKECGEDLTPKVADDMEKLKQERWNHGA